LLPGVAAPFRSVAAVDDLRSLVTAIKDRARALDSEGLDECRRVAQAMLHTWYSSSPSNVRRDVVVLMCTTWGYAAQQIEAERYRPDGGCVAESIKDALGYLHAQLMCAYDSAATYGDEPARWSRRGGYALRAGYYYGRKGPDTLPLLVTNATA
jgi:hypothetical protein